MKPQNPFRPNLKMQKIKNEKRQSREIKLPTCPECERPMAERTQGKIVVLICRCGYTEPVEIDFYDHPNTL